MVEKIIVNPLNVRGKGNIISPKSLADFTVYNSSLSYVNGLYTMEYVASTVTVSLTASASSLNVGESIVLTATVLDDGTAVDGVTVSFTSGNLAIGTAVTGSDGVATLTTSTLTAGSHSIIATYGNAISSPVSVTVNKLTPTISIAKSGDVTVGTAYVISGTLSCSGSVKLYEDGSLIDTLTVSSGAFSKSITKSVTGNFSYYALFDGDSNYNSVTSSSVTVVVSDVAPSYDDIVLSADDSILSYYDGDSTTLRAQLMDGSSTASVSGVTVEFFKGSTSLGTAQTDNNGVATKTYTSTGAGDISLTASDGTLVSETFSIEDCDFYIPEIVKTTTTSTDTSYPSGVDYACQLTNYELSFTYQMHASFRLYFTNTKVTNIGDPCNYGFGFAREGTVGKFNVSTRTTSTSNTQYGNTINEGATVDVRLVVQGTRVEIYYNDSKIVDNTYSWLSSYPMHYLNWAIWKAGTIKAFDIKFKQL